MYVDIYIIKKHQNKRGKKGKKRGAEMRREFPEPRMLSHRAFEQHPPQTHSTQTGNALYLTPRTLSVLLLYFAGGEDALFLGCGNAWPPLSAHFTAI